jgi:hypothetical protein
MHDEQDPVIRRLFAEQEKSRPSEDFMLRLGEAMDAQDRVRRVYRVLAVIACVVLAALSAPWVAQATSMLIELAAAGLGSSGQLLHLPVAWLVLVATAAACSPVIYLWRTRQW